MSKYQSKPFANPTVSHFKMIRCELVGCERSEPCLHGARARGPQAERRATLGRAAGAWRNMEQVHDSRCSSSLFEGDRFICYRDDSVNLLDSDKLNWMRFLLLAGLCGDVYWGEHAMNVVCWHWMFYTYSKPGEFWIWHPNLTVHTLSLGCHVHWYGVRYSKGS